MVTRHGTLLLAAGLAAAGIACAPKNTASIQAARICSMPDDCKFSEKCAAQIIYNPRIDVSAGEPLWLAVELHNNLPNNESGGHLNTNDAHFTSYELEYSDPRAAISPTEISGQTSGIGRAQQLIPAGGTAVIGFEPIPLTVVNSVTSAPVGPDFDEVLVKVTFKGNLEDGSEWELPYEIPVEVCANCIAAPTCDDPKQIPIFACPGYYQSPRGATKCTTPGPACVTAGTFCGSSANIKYGDPKTLYVCTSGGDAAPANSVVCTTGCDATTNTCT